MSKPIKVILWGSVAVIVLIAAPVLYISLNLNKLIKQGIETAGPQVTETSVSLGSSNISIFSGKGELNNLVIGNPKGFESDSIFELGSIHMSVDIDSVTEDVIVINDITISKPRITLELKEGGSNIKKLMKSIRNAGKRLGRQSAKNDADSQEEPGNDIRLIIHTFTITDGSVRILVPALNKEIKNDLPKLVLKDVGKDKNGITVSEASIIVMGEVEKTLMSATRDDIGNLGFSFGDQLGNGKSFSDKFKDEAGKLTDSIKGLFQ